MDPSPKLGSSNWELFSKNLPPHSPPSSLTPASTLTGTYRPPYDRPVILLLVSDAEINPGPIRILQLNCRSLKMDGKKEELAILAKKHKYDIMLLSETWLRSENRTLKIPRSAVVNRQDRTDDTQLGGGVISFAHLQLPVINRATR